MNIGKSKVALSIAASLTLSGYALAEQPKDKSKLEIIEVTAQKVVQSIQEVPISVTAFNGDQIESNGIKNLSELSQYVPNLTIANNAINTNIFMRGIGSGNNRAFEQSVGMFIDGVYMGRGRQYRSPFLDLERAEILRGPQGILFGKNTIAGTVNLSTTKASAGDDFEGSVAFEWDPEYEQKSLTGILSGSLSDELGLRLVAKDASSEGYSYNTSTDRNEAATDEKIVRLSVNWEPSSDLNIHAKLEHSEFNVRGNNSEFIGLTPFGPLASYMAFVAMPAYDADFEATANHQRSSDEIQGPISQETEANNFSLNADYSLDAGVLTFVTGYSDYKTDDSNDGEFGPTPITNTVDKHDFQQISQEIRFASQGNETFDYITGVFYQEQELQIDMYTSLLVDPILPVLNGVFASVPAALLNPALAGSGLNLLDIGLNPDSVGRAMDFAQDTTTLSGFFQGTYKVTDDFRVIIGGRYTKETKDAVRKTLSSTYDSEFYQDAIASGLNATVTSTLLGVIPTVPFYEAEREENQFTPSLKFQFDVSPDIMVYGTAEKGFKSGGVNAAPDAKVSSNEFEPEEALGFEFGIKSDLLDGSARLNAAVFRTKFDNMQVTSWTGFGFEVGNAAESVTQGVEVDGQIILSDNWMLGGSLAYLDAHYESFEGGPCTAEILNDASDGRQVCDLTDKDLPFAPSTSASIFLDYEVEFESTIFTASFNVNYSDEYYVDIDVDENLKQEAETKINLRIGLAAMDDTWDIALVGKNLTDRTTFSAGIDAPLVAGGYVGFIDAPRTITLQGRYRF